MYQMYTLYYNVTIRDKLDDMKGGKEHFSFHFGAPAVAVIPKIYKKSLHLGF